MKEVSFQSKLQIGALSGIAGSGIIYPLDIIKTTIQAKSVNIPSQFTSNYQRMLYIYQQIYRNSGFRGLYRGFSTCLIGIAPEKAIKLAVNDFIREYYSKTNRRNKLLLHEEIISGSIAGILQLTVTVPYEMVKIRLQLNKNNNVTGVHVLKELGIFGIYRGFSATLLRDVPFCSIFFALYSNLKSFLNGFHNKEEPFYIGLVSGVISGGIAGSLVTPADMIKTRIQQGLNGNLGMVAYSKQILQQEGSKAFFLGWQQRSYIIGTLYGLVSLAFEVQKRWLSTYSD